MKILIVAEYYWPHIGGVEILFKNLAEGLVKKGHKVSLVTCRVKGSKRYEELNGVKIYRVWVPQKADRYFFTITSLWKVWRLSKKADLIHGTLYNAAIPAWVASKLRRKKAVLTVHEVFGARWVERFDTSYIFAKVHQVLESLILKFKFPAYICVSNSTARDLKPFLPKKSSLDVIYNGIDTEMFKPKNTQKPNEFTYLFYGRPGISKGADILVKAAALVKKELPNTRLKMILAKKPKKGYLQVENLINKLKLNDFIELQDPVPYQDLPKHVSAAHAVVVPSLAEGFGFTTAETCALGVPIVVSEAASLPEVASGQVIFVKPGDVDDLARGMINAFHGKFKSVPKKIFSWDKNVSEHLDLYKKLCPKNH